MRELKTYPGELFSRDNVYRSIREIQQLSYFDPEKINPDIKPNAEGGTVDIDYQVEEKSSSTFDVSGGWGSNMVIFSAGISLTNFSTQKLFKKDAWRPFPTGDGQRVSLRVQTNGTYYTLVNLSFTEPWLGGRKPQALTGGIYYSYQDDGYWNTTGDRAYYMGIFGASVSLSKRLKWPDDYFIFSQGITFQQYNVKDYPSFLYKRLKPQDEQGQKHERIEPHRVERLHHCVCTKRVHRAERERFHFAGLARFVDINTERKTHGAYLHKVYEHHRVRRHMLGEKREDEVVGARAVVCDNTHKLAAERTLPGI
jgi:outer membrane protein assembly factor BamA